MRLFGFIVVTAALWTTPLAAQVAQSPAWPELDGAPVVGGGEKDAAVLIGIDKYLFLPAIPGATANIDAWETWLMRSRKVVNVTTLRDNQATNSKIMKSVRAAALQVKPGGTLWFVFVGHGAPSRDGRDGLLVGVDTQADIDELIERSVLQQTVLDALGAAKGANIVAIFDACFSGQASNGKLLATGMMAVPPNRRVAEPTTKLTVLSSSDTFAGPLPGASRPAFSYLLLGALRGWADDDNDSSVTLEEAFRFARGTLQLALKNSDRLPAARGKMASVSVKAVEKAPELDALLAGRCPAGERWLGRACSASQAAQLPSATSRPPTTPPTEPAQPNAPTQTAPTSENSAVDDAALFARAKEQLEQGAAKMDAGKIEDAVAMLESGADSYLQLLGRDAWREYADVLLYNAALAFEKARRPSRAASLYERLYRDYPTSEYASEAMFRVANKSEQAFDFDKATATYGALVKKYPASERCADAQINLALALEGQQAYDRAAQEFERYAALFPDKPDAADVFFRASIVYKKARNATEEIAVLRRFIARYRSDLSQVPKVVEAEARLGELFFEQAKKVPAARTQSIEAYESSVRDWNQVQGNQQASYFAAKSAFALAELQYEQFARLAVTARTGDKQVKELTAKSNELQRLEEVYKKIITTYKIGEWSLASLYRIASLYHDMQQAVLRSPCPDDVRRQFGAEGCDIYATTIEDNAFAIEEKAVANYKVAYDKGHEFKLTNSWTQKTVEALNLLRPLEYPIDKQPLGADVSTPEAPAGLTLPDGGAPELMALGAGPAESAIDKER